MHGLSRMIILLVISSIMFSACGAPASTPTVVPPTATSSDSVPTAPQPTAAPAPTSQPEQTVSNAVLRIGTGLNIATSLIATQGTVGYNMITYGAGETLMRLTPDQQLVPWLAERIERTDERTWKIQLRKGIRFHDGMELKASDIVASFQSSWAELAGAKNFIAKETVVSAIDDYTVSFVTPEPAGNLPDALANWNFVIHKAPINEISIMTGMYRPVSLEKDQEMVFERFDQYWGGTPALAGIRVQKIPDANARALALQSGDLDMLTNVPPEVALSLPADIETTSVPGTRLHHIILNNTKAPFDDVRVREAASAAIDRTALLQATLDGQGAIATSIYPPSVGIKLEAIQNTDLSRAQQLLEEAGWVVGSDGIREKAGQKLSFLLYSYPGRPELTQMAVAIQAQLKAVGFDVKVEEVKDIVETIQNGNFQASMFSVNVSSDPQYMPGITLIEGASFNYGGYANEELENLFAQLRAESDSELRQELALQMQAIVKRDVPNIYLAVPPLITAFRVGSLGGYIPHPNDLYLINQDLRLTE
jgi:peptide/nickel transport system substrate-binding protein